MDAVIAGLAFFLIVLALSVIMALSGREVVCWYLKINEQLVLLEQIRTELIQQNQKLSGQKTSSSTSNQGGA
jgi:hypothetical protein